MHTEAEADIQTHRSDSGAHHPFPLLSSIVISCYEGMESQSNQAPLGITLTSTPVNSGGFILINAANIGRMSTLPIDF